MIHTAPHPLAGKTVEIYWRQGETVSPRTYRVEDYWDRVAGQSWMDSGGNPAALQYAMRSGLSGLPLDNDVLYGKIGDFGHLVHVSELGGPDA